MYRHQSNESQRPLSGAYGQDTNVYHLEKKKGRNKWCLIGIPLLFIVVAGAAVGVVIGLRAAKKNSNSTSSGHVDPNNLEHFATSTNSYYQPIYPSITQTAEFGPPTFANLAADQEWPADDFQPSGQPSFTNLRPHPRIIAPDYKWQALPKLIQKDPYLKGWNDIIMSNATTFSNLPPVVHVFDGGPAGSGILDPAREVKNRIKHFGYAYRMTQDTKWVDRAWRELDNAANWGDDPADPWNTPHFLDCAELTAAFGIAYDWFYDKWTPDQKNTLRDAIVNYGLQYGLQVYKNTSYPNGWWHNDVNGNWNCVSNGGLIIGSLAIYEDDTTGTASELLPLAIDNAVANCARVPSPDGTGSETANYWEFAITGLSELTSALLTATGGDFQMLTTNPGLEQTSIFRMYVTGMTSLFDYGDHGPNKFSTTANALLFLATAYKRPEFMLYQRDRWEAPEPWSMFWYDPSVEGAWWRDLPLDHVFEDPSDSWASFRTSWTDVNGAFIALKAGALQHHQTHGDLDCGDFVLDALGQRFAGEHGSANYLNPNYFSNETQQSDRWTLYRKMTEGQNVIAINGQNQDVNAKPTIRSGTSQTAQGASLVFSVPQDSTAFVVADLTSAYNFTVKRGLRFINGRRQILLQDELTDVTEKSQWRVQTNATISIDSTGRSATLSLGGEKLIAQILTPDGVTFQDLPSERTDAAPPIRPGLADESNGDARVLAIDIPEGTNTLQVLFNPQWHDFSNFMTPPSVPLDSWQLDSHN